MIINCRWLLLFGSVFIASCAVGPDYKRPTAPVTAKYKEAKQKKIIAADKRYQWKIAEPNDTFDHGQWWKIFNDAELSGYEDRLNHCNQSIAAAYDNYKQAQTLVDEARANFYPVLLGTASLQRQKGTGSTNIVSTSNSGSLPTGTSSSGINGSGPAKINYNHSIIFNTSWQPDIWGLVRRQVEAGESAAQASAALLAATRLSSQASLATFYFELRALDKDQQILDATVASDKKILKLTINQ